MGNFTLTAAMESWPLKTPFRISRESYTHSECLVVTLTQGEHTGRGEAQGVDYEGETPDSMLAQVDSVRHAMENGMSRTDLQAALPLGGARNALDCALWDLEAKQSGKSIWELLGHKPKPVKTVFTIGLEDTPEAMAQKATDASQFPVLKIKLSEDRPIENLAAIRKARPDARLIVDVNQGWSFVELNDMLPRLLEVALDLLEQPLEKTADDDLIGFQSPILLAADESCLDSKDLAHAAARYDVINIKLDKTGGLTEALKLAHQAKALGKKLMVGNNVGTSLSMAPAFVIAQYCDFVDLDGPLLLSKDREHGIRYEGPVVNVFGRELWG
ncbi:MAG: N-acetyl-D-Glu racemase DgcA [Pseudomonadota bacterium]